MKSSISWLIVAVAAGVPAVIASRHAAHAHARADRAGQELSAVTQQARDLAANRQRAPRPALDQPGGSGLTARLSAALSRAGLAASCLVNLSPEPETALPDAGGQSEFKRLRASLTLGGLTLPQLGSFLAEWARAEPAWIVASLDVAPVSSAAGPGGGDLPLRVVMSIESLRSAGPPRRNPPGAALENQAETLTVTSYPHRPPTARR